MSRFQRFSQSLVTGYVLMGINVVYTFLTFPLALRYLTKPEVSLWAQMATISTLAQMLDLGMSSSIARILVDHKDDRKNGRYGSTLKAGFLVGATQCGIALLIGLGTIWFLGDWLRISPTLSVPFFWLMATQIFVSAMSFLTRMPNQLLFAWQRLDVQNYAQMLQLGCGLLTLWAGLALHWGVYSIVASTLVAWAVSSAWSALACHRLGFWPRQGEWGRATRDEFNHLFNYGADLFLMALGAQLIISTQILLIQYSLGGVAGGEAVVVWKAMTTVFAMMTQLIIRFIGYTMPAFAEMMVRRESRLFWERYRSMFIMASMLATGAALMLAAGNSLFVRLWTHGTNANISWPFYNDALLGAWIILSTQQCCHNSIIACLKEVREVKYVLLLEGLVFVVASVWCLPRWGLTGMLLCSIICTVVFTWLNSTWRISRLVRENQLPPLWQWQMPVLALLAVTVPCWLLLRSLLQSQSALVQFLVTCPVLAVIAAIVVLRFALPRAMIAELLGRLPLPARRLIARMAD